jgi:hypothetical protein
VSDRFADVVNVRLIHRLSCFVCPMSGVAVAAWQFDEYDSHRL